jgi:hypothetical protein
MDRLFELASSERLLALLSKLEAVCTNVLGLDERFTRIERAISDLRDHVLSQRTVKEFYTPGEVADLLGKARYTVREWCRLGRINAHKGTARFGSETDWRISHEELIRYQNEGLLPPPPLAAWR